MKKSKSIQKIQNVVNDLSKVLAKKNVFMESGKDSNLQNLFHDIVNDIVRNAKIRKVKDMGSRKSMFSGAGRRSIYSKAKKDKSKMCLKKMLNELKEDRVQKEREYKAVHGEFPEFVQRRRRRSIRRAKQKIVAINKIRVGCI